MQIHFVIFFSSQPTEPTIKKSEEIIDDQDLPYRISKNIREKCTAYKIKERDRNLERCVQNPRLTIIDLAQ
jgi:hypothetical protein